MQLNQGEQAIFAYFGNDNTAEKAAVELKNMGYSNVQVDRVSKYGVSNNAEYNNPIMGRATTGTGLSLFSASSDRYMGDDNRILMGADPSVSGMSGNGAAGGENILLNVVTGERSSGPAVEIIEKYGGKF